MNPKDRFKAFGTFLSNVDLDVFFDNNWLKQPLYAPNPEEDRETYISVEELDDYFNIGHLTYPTVDVIGGEGTTVGGDELLYDQNMYRSAFINKRKLYEQFYDGRSIVINYGHLAFPKLNKLVEEFQREFQTPVHTNIYITPSNSSGFAPHFDGHEVFVLQVHGTKRWHIYDKPYDDCNRSQMPREKSKEYADSEPVHDLILYPGDVLYVPKGVVHKAHTEDHDSIHITLGINYVKERSLLTRLVKSGAFDDDTDMLGAEENVLENLLNKVKDVADTQKQELFSLCKDEFFDAQGLFTGAMVVGLINSSEDLEYIQIDPTLTSQYNPPNGNGPISDMKKALKDELFKGEIKLSLK